MSIARALSAFRAPIDQKPASPTPGAAWIAGVSTASILAISLVASLWIRGLGARSDVPSLLPLLVSWAIAASVVGFRGPARGIVVIVAVAAVARAPWVGTPLHLSDDVYRYLFEGRASALGHDVFLTAPAALDGVDDALRAKVNHPTIPSVYPPLALWWFRLLSAAGGVSTAQGLTAVADVVTVGLVARWGSPRGAMVLALHPLMVVESANGAHVDLPACTLAVAAVAASRAGWPIGALGLATMGTWTKLFPIVLGPSLLRPLSWPARAAVVVAGAASAVVLAAPHLTFGPHLWSGGVKSYATTWSFAGFLFPALEPVLGGATRGVLGASAAALLAAAHVRWRDPAVIWLVAGTLFCLLSPTVHPWYVCWALVPSAFLGRGEWALASAGSLCAYAVLGGYDAATGRWVEVAGVGWLVWGLAAAGALAGSQLARSDDHPTAP